MGEQARNRPLRRACAGAQTVPVMPTRRFAPALALALGLSAGCGAPEPQPPVPGLVYLGAHAREHPGLRRVEVQADLYNPTDEVLAGAHLEVRFASGVTEVLEFGDLAPGARASARASLLATAPPSVEDFLGAPASRVGTTPGGLLAATHFSRVRLGWAAGGAAQVLDLTAAANAALPGWAEADGAGSSWPAPGGPSGVSAP